MVFHGTSLAAARRIGITLERGSFVTEGPALAEMYAALAALRDHRGDPSVLQRQGIRGALLEVSAPVADLVLDPALPDDDGRQFQLRRPVPIRSRRLATFTMPPGAETRAELEQALAELRDGWLRKDRPPLPFAAHSRERAAGREGVLGRRR
jgi:hypothetical protein